MTNWGSRSTLSIDDKPSQKQLLNNITHASDKTVQKACDRHTESKKNRRVSRKEALSKNIDQNRLTTIKPHPLVWKYARRKVGPNGINRLEVGVDENGSVYVFIHNNPIR